MPLAMRDTFEVFSAIALLSVLPVARPASSQEIRPYTLAGTEVHRIASNVVGDTFEVSVALPLGYDQADRRYPVVIALDADLTFAAVAQISRLMQFREEVPEFLVVGIGYGDMQTALEKRFRDFTPTVDETNAACAVAGACGGAEQFAGFIASELLPFVAGRFRADLDDLTLVGNSLGGLFGGYLLLRRPDLFNRYLLGSPALAWDGSWMLDAIARMEMARDRTARVYVGVGGDEGMGVGHARTFVDRLQSLRLESLSASFQVFEHEGHMSAQPMVVTRGLRVLFGTAPGGVLQPGSG